MKPTLNNVTAAILLATFLGWGAAHAAKAPAAPASVTDFSLKDVDGKTVKLSSLGGKAYVVDVWATWCPPCKQELPQFVALQKKYADKGLKIVGIAVDDDGAEAVKPFLAKNPLNYTVVLDQPDALTAIVGEVKTLPTTFFVTGDLKIHNRVVGYEDLAATDKEIQAILPH